MPTVPAMSKSFVSSCHIGELVKVKIDGVEIPGRIRAVIFTSSKVRYSVRVGAEGSETTLHNVDSAFVVQEPDETKRSIIVMPEDNYS